MSTEKSIYSTLKSKLRKLRKAVRCFVIKNIDIKNKDSLFGFIVWFVIRYIPGFLPRPILKLVNKIRDNVSSSWHKSIPEYPLYILAIIVGILLGAGYLWWFGDKYGKSSSFMTGWLTLSAAPLVLIMWKWRNTHKNSEIKIQQRNANEALLLKAGEQLGHESEISRLCGIESIDRYARLMIEQDEPDYPEFQRAVSMLCGFVRQKNAEKRRAGAVKVTQMGDAYRTSGEVASPEDKKSYLVNETDYKSCVDLIFRLMRDYYDELMGCCIFPSKRSFCNDVRSECLSFPLVDLEGCDLRFFVFSGRLFLVNAKFNGTVFSNAIFSQTTLDWACFNGAKLNGTIFNFSKLNSAALNDAQLNDAQLNEAKLNGAMLNGAMLNGARLNKAELNDAMLNDAMLNNAILNNAILNNAILNKDTKITEKQLKTAKSIHGLKSKLYNQFEGFFRQ